MIANGWGDPPSAAIRELEEFAQSCPDLNLGPVDCRFVNFYAAMFSGDPDRMIYSIEQSAGAPGEIDVPLTHGYLAQAYAVVGRTEDAVASAERAMAMSPEDPSTIQWLSSQARAYFATERYEEAKGAALRGLDLRSNDAFNFQASLNEILAAALGQLGEIEEAEAALAEARGLRTNMTPERLLIALAAASQDHRDRYLEGLRLAGLGAPDEIDHVATSPIWAKLALPLFLLAIVVFLVVAFVRTRHRLT